MNVVVPDNLYAIAPWVPEIEERTVDEGDTRCVKGFARRLLIFNDQSEVTVLVRGLFTALLKRDKLITQVNKSHGVILAAQLEFEQTTIER